MTKEEIKIYKHEWYLAHKDEYIIKHRDYYILNKDKWGKYNGGGNWQKNNPERNRRNKREYEKKRKKEDPTYYLIHKMRRFINFNLKSNNAKKTNRTFELVGCTPEFLKKYIENQFTEGMTFENTHVDHIIPLTFFSLQYEDEQKKAFHYLNLQPLFDKDNLEKFNNLDTSFYNLISFEPSNGKRAVNKWKQ